MTSGEGLLERLQAFFRLLESANFTLSTSRRLDAIQPLEYVSMENPTEVRLAIRSNLCRDAREQAMFDLLFRSFWLGESIDIQSLESLQASQDSDQDVEEQGGQASKTHRRKGGELEDDWASFDEDLEAAIQQLKRNLHKTKGRRWISAKRGAQLDLRRTLAGYIRGGLEFSRFLYKGKKPNRVKLICLIDVSNSMSTHMQYLTRFVLAVHRVISGSRTIFFSSAALDMTRFVNQNSNDAVIAEIETAFPWWQSGTDIGSAMGYVNQQIPQGAFRNATVIVVSDGFDRGDEAKLVSEIGRLSRAAKRLIWINPLLHTRGYEPTAKGMAAALPFVDDFLAAFDAASLLFVLRKISLG